MRLGRSIGRVLIPGLAALAAVSGRLLAQDVSVRAQAVPSRVAQGEQLTLLIEILAPSFDQTAPPDLSGIEDFDVVGGPSRASRFQWINGRTSSSLTFSYVLRPRKSGVLEIPSLGLLVRGRTYRTRPVQVEVLPGGGGRPPGGGPPLGPGYGGQPAGPGAPPRTPAPVPGADVRVRAEVDSRTAYVGQQITARFLLDTQTEVLNLQLKETPSFPDFWSEEIKLPENLDLKRVQVGTEPYNEYTLMKRALFPTNDGSLTIPPVAYQIQVRRRSQDPIESFFFTPTETIVRRTEPIAITVLPLPAGPKPPGFSGAVGSFTLSVAADRKDSKVNDAIGVKVRIAGEGSLGAVNASPLSELSDFKQYPPKVTASTSAQGDRIRADKTWDYVLIPLAPGAQSVPPVTFSFFDPKAREYRTLTSAPIAIQVARGDERPGASYPAIAQSDVRLLRQDIHYIKSARDGLSDRSRPLYRSPLFTVFVLLPLVANLGLLVYVRGQDLSRAHRRERRERRARARARRSLREARRRMTPPTARAFYAAVAQALTEYVADKFDTSAVGLTHQKIEELLQSRRVADALRAEYHRCLEACDYARFAPTSSSLEEMRKTLQTAENTLVALDRSLQA